MAYAAVWVGLLWGLGMYRLRARWRLRTEILDVVRAGVLLGLITFSALFVVKLPDVSRLFLLTLFVGPGRADLRRPGRRSAGSLRALRDRGYNLRYMLVVGTGPAAPPLRRPRRAPPRARAAGHRPPRRLEPGAPTMIDRRPVLGTIDDIEDVLHDHVVDEVAICLPGEDLATHRADHPAVRGGGQDRPDPGRRRPGQPARRPRRGVRRDPGPVARLRPGPGPRPRRQARSSTSPWSAARARSCCARPAAVVALVIAAPRRAADPLPPDRASGSTAGRSRSSSSGRWCPTPRTGWPSSSEHNEIKGHAFKLTDDPRLTRTGPAPARDEPRRAAPALERPARRDEPRRARGRRCPTRGRGLRPVAPPPAVDEAGHHRPVAGRGASARRTSTGGSSSTSPTSTAGRSGSTSRSCSGRSRRCSRVAEPSAHGAGGRGGAARAAWLARRSGSRRRRCRSTAWPARPS